MQANALRNTKLIGQDSPWDVLQKMSEMHQGALRLLGEIIMQCPSIDPDNLLNHIGVFNSLDYYNIYGKRLYTLYDEVCHKDMVRFLAAIRAVQIGIIPEKQLSHAIDNGGSGFDTDVVLSAVQSQLPRFGKQ